MLRHRGARASDVEAHVLASARSEQDALYRDELAGPRAARRAERRLDLHAHPAARAGAATRAGSTPRCSPRSRPAPGEPPLIFVCGPTPFVEAVADLLVDAGHDPRTIHAERFGPTGG